MSENELKKRQDFKQEILNLIRSKYSPKVIRDRLEEYHANDIAAILPLLSAKEREMLYRLLTIDRLAEMLEYADDADQYLEEMDMKRAARILENMEQDEAVDLLKESDSQKKKAWMDLMNEESRKELQALAAYDEDTIASRMTTNYVTLTSDLTIKEAMRSLVNQAAEHDNISVLYVLDENDVYYGAIDLKDLIIARQTAQLEDLIVTAYPYVYADEKIEDCLETIKDYSEESIPVLSDDNRIIGVITAQDVIEVVDDEMGEDYAKLGGLTEEEDLEEPLKESLKKRLPWLALLFCLGLGVSSVVGMFEKVVAELTIVMAFQSLILGMAGNVGTQSLAVTIRVLIGGKLSGKQKWHLIGKEMRVGGLNGIILGLLSTCGVGIYIALIKHYPPNTAFMISACIGIAMFVSMVISSFVGTVVPVFFKQIGVDPAVASGPLISTINDLVGVVTYYSLAWVLLIDALHLG